MRRLGAFLSLPEPPEPWHAQKAAASGADGSAKGGSSSGSRGRRVHASGNGAVQNGHAPAAAVAAAGGNADAPAVEVAGADFDWTDRSWAAGVPAAAVANGSAAQPVGAAGASASAGGAFQLRRLQFAVPRGQLVAIVGAVGTGE
jgi:hypothetical protein